MGAFESHRPSRSAGNAAIQNAIRRLIASQIVVRVDHGSYRFEDAPFAEWIADRQLL
jgi:hypothetical protein